MIDVRVMWPFDVNWASSYRITYEFSTDLFVNRAGGEQRRALRQNPRKRIAFIAQVTGDRLRRFDRLMATAQNMPIVMPEMTRRAETSAATGSGATSVQVAGTIPPWIVQGAEIVLMTRDDRRVGAIASVVGSTVTFAATVGAWPAGTVLHPALTGYLDAEIVAPRKTSAIASAEIVFDVEPGFEVYAPSAAPLILDGREVFTLDPNWIEEVDVRHLWPVERVDFGFGRVAVHKPVDFPARLSSAVYLQRSAAESEALLDLFLRAKGRRGTFFMPTWQDDLPAAAPLTATGATLRVAGTDLFDGYAADPVHGAVAVRLAGGGTICRTIAAMAVDAGDTLVTVSQAWGQNVSVASIESLSWLLLSRFASDTLTMEWQTSTVAQAKFGIQSLPTAAPSDYLALRATVEGDNRETVAGDDRAVVYLA